MANLIHTDISYIQKFVETVQGVGYVLNFSNTDFQRFINQVAKIDIDERKYEKYGSSKGKRFKAFLEMENDEKVGNN